MDISKKKNPKACLLISIDFKSPRVWIFVWKLQRFGKNLETFGKRIFFLRFLKSVGCFGSVLSTFHFDLYIYSLY